MHQDEKGINESVGKKVQQKGYATKIFGFMFILF